MKIIYKSIGPKKVGVQFAKELLRHLNEDLLSITIIPQEKSADCSVITVINSSSEDIVETLALSYSKLHTTISFDQSTQDG